MKSLQEEDGNESLHPNEVSLNEEIEEQISSLYPDSNSESEKTQLYLDELFPLITPHVDEATQKKLTDLYLQLRNNVISRNSFFSNFQSVVGREMIVQAMVRLKWKEVPVRGIQRSQLGKLPLQESMVQDRLRKQRKSVSCKFPEEKDQKGDSAKVNQNTSPTVATSGSTSLGPGLICPENQASFVTSSLRVSKKSLMPVPPTTPSLRSGIGKKRIVSSQPKKKQKVSGNLEEKDVENLNDVTGCSGVDLTKEEEQLFSVSKPENRASEASSELVQEEENRVIFEREPFEKKLAEILSKCGIKNVGEDVERCLSLCVEKRLQGVIEKSIRASRKRVDSERSRHPTIVTSDVQHQIELINRMSKKDSEKNHVVEVEKSRTITEACENTPAKTNKKEEGEKVMSTPGNDEFMSKWRDMAAKARQKSEGRDSTCIARVSKPCSTPDMVSRECHDGLSGQKRKFGRDPVVRPVKEIERSISAKDVIAVLQREPQMSKSPLLYRLYERMRSGNVRTLE